MTPWRIDTLAPSSRRHRARASWRNSLLLKLLRPMALPLLLLIATTWLTKVEGLNMKKLTIKVLFITIALSAMGTTAHAASSLSLPTDPSDFRDPQTFMQICTELNQNVSGNEQLCQMAWASLESNQH